MPIRTVNHIIRKMLKDEPESLFVFGDNLERRGLGGQAAEMRGEPNAVGIPTKKAPGMHPVDFFSDRDLDAFTMAAAPDFTRLTQHLYRGGVVVMPTDGIGTGRARLQQAAPRVWAELQHNFRTMHLAAEQGSVVA